MKAHDDNTGKSEELVLLLRNLVDQYLKDSQLGVNFQKILGDKKLLFGKKKSPTDKLDALRVKLDKANLEYKDRSLIHNPSDPKYIEKKLIREYIPSILAKNKNVDAALAEFKSLTDFLKSDAIVKGRSKDTKPSQGKNK